MSKATSLYTVPTIAALKALGGRPPVVEVTDTLPGTFAWYGANASTADDIDVVQPTSGPAGRYLRQGAINGSKGNNLWQGYNALTALTSGVQNTGIGYEALKAMTTDTYATGVGYQALLVNTGHANTGFGAGAGASITTATDCVAIGADALHNVDDPTKFVTGLNNVGVGVHALGHLTSGNLNVAIGHLAMVGGGAYIGVPTTTLTGDLNIGIGYLALGAITGAMAENVSLGAQSLNALASGNQNIAIGAYSNRFLTAGSLNITIGRDVQTSTTTSSNELNIGNLITATGLTQGGAASGGKVGFGLDIPSGATPAKEFHLYNASGPTFRLDAGSTHHADIGVNTSGVLLITPESYTNITGDLVSTGSITSGPTASPYTGKTNTAGGGTFLNGAVTNANQFISAFTQVARGTVASPSAVTFGDNVAAPLRVQGYDGSGYQDMIRIVATVGGAVSAGVVPGWMALQTANGSGAMTTAVFIDQAQRLATTQEIAVGSFIEGLEQTAPSAAPSNGYRIFAQDNGAGKTQLMVIFNTGAAQQIAIQP